MFNIGLTSISVGASVFVLKIHFRGQNIHSVPKWIKNVFGIDLRMESEMKKLTRFKNMLIKNRDSKKISSISNKESFDYLLETTKRYLKNCELTNRSKSDLIYDEWRLCAQKLDFILFFISLVVVFMTPIIIFGKFYLRDNMSNVTNQCSCFNYNI
jgi:hypothetical protein